MKEALTTAEYKRDTREINIHQGITCDNEKVARGKIHKKYVHVKFILDCFVHEIECDKGYD